MPQAARTQVTCCVPLLLSCILCKLTEVRCSLADNCDLNAGGVDDEVGAFVRLIQDARPLDSSTCASADALHPTTAGLSSRWSPGSSVLGHERSLQAGLDQLKAFKVSLQAGQEGPSAK